jgi:hypothetical protein
MFHETALRIWIRHDGADDGRDPAQPLLETLGRVAILALRRPVACGPCGLTVPVSRTIARDLQPQRLALDPDIATKRLFASHRELGPAAMLGHLEHVGDGVRIASSRSVAIREVGLGDSRCEASGLGGNLSDTRHG